MPSSILAFVKGNLFLSAALVLLAGFVVVHVIWYIHPSREIVTVADFDARLRDGTPTVVEYYSNL